MNFAAPSIARLADAVTDRVVRSLYRAIVELQGVRIAQGELIEGVSLANATEVPIPHGLGRAARVFCSPPRGASSSGRIEEVRSSSYDSKTFVVLEATGYGATVTVDVWVF